MPFPLPGMRLQQVSSEPYVRLSPHTALQSYTSTKAAHTADKLVRKVGLEPTHLSARVPKTRVSAISPLPHLATANLTFAKCAYYTSAGL